MDITVAKRRQYICSGCECGRWWVWPEEEKTWRCWCWCWCSGGGGARGGGGSVSGKKGSITSAAPSITGTAGGDGVDARSFVDGRTGSTGGSLIGGGGGGGAAGAGAGDEADDEDDDAGLVDTVMEGGGKMDEASVKQEREHMRYVVYCVIIIDNEATSACLLITSFIRSFSLSVSEIKLTQH